MIKNEIGQLVQAAVRKAQEAGDLPAAAIPDAPIERPQRPEHGDYSTGLAMRMARAAQMSPLDIAKMIAKHIDDEAQNGVFAAVEVAPPGFINFRLSSDWLAAQVDVILAAGPEFGNISLGAGTKVQVEFVSANPVGPIHVGNGRGLALGDTLARALAAAGFEVEREYLVNDAGTQTDIFADTLYVRYQRLFGREVEMPEGGYPGEYMIDLANALKDEFGDSLLRPEGEPRPPEVHDRGVALMLDNIRQDLDAIGVRYDSWFSERSVYDGGTYEKAMALLRERGFVSEREGAVWFVSSSLGDEKDNVLVRSSGAPTYFASDIAYHYDKFVTRGFDRVINIWGADHQGHVPRMKAAVAALDIDPARLEIIIYQLVTVKRGDEVIRLSKRAGDIITLRSVVEEVGADAARYNFVTRAADSHMEFDIELAKRKSAENPVYYVQYAHARIVGILTQAAERGIDFKDGDVGLLKEDAELNLVRKMLRLPELIEQIALTNEPHQLPYYATEMATTFHDFYEKCRVLSDDEALTRARLKLVSAAKAVLARSLDLMGMSAPERM
ncbi:MAG: arginine--tRNA ligase [Chloroflexi bacterium]|nr:arginine--tRNA ligase [Chloroflexota bacterium]MCI0782933.1 arginine--tRNA ligase [Chloroflexota bacterium]MCI0815398.1 arginine--tRNA ligase [Chloroflexota bacterium]MCI0816703.1 arginine--tRNA ligase [Chloroflexota bacterium]MCI0831557.1 arginine--tRNA ligase [Chloroflexota bacterium]